MSRRKHKGAAPRGHRHSPSVLQNAGSSRTALAWAAAADFYARSLPDVFLERAGAHLECLGGDQRTRFADGGTCWRVPRRRGARQQQCSSNTPRHNRVVEALLLVVAAPSTVLSSTGVPRLRPPDTSLHWSACEAGRRSHCSRARPCGASDVVASG
jgi:hypothetical protein